MSQDLFAAFGSPETSGANTAASSISKQTTPAGLPPGTSNSDTGIASLSGSQTYEDDDFGDFEDASAPPATSVGSGYPPSKPTSQQPQDSKQKQSRGLSKPDPTIGRHPFAGNMDILFAADDDEYNAGADEMNDLANNPEAAMEYSKRIIAEQQAEQEQKAQPQVLPQTASKPPATGTGKLPTGPNKLRKKSGYAPPKDPNVLFDADDVSEDGDFGDFEGAISSTGETNQITQEAKQPPAQSSMPAIDLLGLDDTQTGSIPPPAPTDAPPEVLDRQHPKSEITAASVQDDEDWDDFEGVEFASTSPSKRISNLSTRELPFQRSAPAAESKSDRSVNTTQLPPTNIPPPVILLSMFPSLFSSAQDTLFGPLAKLGQKQRQTLLAHPATHTFLKSYLSLATVLAHIIAGRRLRWKRDQYLAQGMRIGPAAGGGKGGMKLAGVDKGEAAKEDREVLDAISTWKAQVGKLRTAVTTASSAPGTGKLPPVPEIAQQMPVKTLKPTEGGMTAPHACALCGLKREERVAKVDVEISDSFGEWWVDGASMHLVCRNFWDEHKGKLKSR